MLLPHILWQEHFIWRSPCIVIIFANLLFVTAAVLFSTALCYIYIAVFKLPPKPVPTAHLQSKNVLQSGLKNIFNFFQKNCWQINWAMIVYRSRVSDKQKEAPLAQLVEHLTLNQGVQGSNPWRRTKGTVFADIELRGRCFFVVFMWASGGIRISGREVMRSKWTEMKMSIIR